MGKTHKELWGWAAWLTSFAHRALGRSHCQAEERGGGVSFSCCLPSPFLGALRQGAVASVAAPLPGGEILGKLVASHPTNQRHIFGVSDTAISGIIGCWDHKLFCLTNVVGELQCNSWIPDSRCSRFSVTERWCGFQSFPSVVKDGQWLFVYVFTSLRIFLE